MNNLAIFIGILFLVVGIIGNCVNLSSAIDKQKEPKPKHGDRRLVRFDDQYIWQEKYIEYPGWILFQRFNTLEEATADQKVWENLISNDKEIIKPKENL